MAATAGKAKRAKRVALMSREDQIDLAVALAIGKFEGRAVWTGHINGVSGERRWYLDQVPLQVPPWMDDVAMQATRWALDQSDDAAAFLRAASPEMIVWCLARVNVKLRNRLSTV